MPSIITFLNLQYIPTSDEFELEFSSSSRAELWRFRAEPSWGTLILELKPSWQYVYQISQFCPYNMILINFMIIYLNLFAQKVFLELNNMIVDLAA